MPICAPPPLQLRDDWGLADCLEQYAADVGATTVVLGSMQVWCGEARHIGGLLLGWHGASL